MASTINTKIQLRTDSKTNWESVNPVLKLGEIAIVCFDDDYKDIKIGNGLSTFNQLSYLYQNEIKTDKITGKDLNVKSIAQGYNVKATPTSLATGVFSYADGNFDVVHGIEAQAKEGDDYAFVFNGKNLPLDGKNFYVSHGEGTFNVNPKDGLSGFYIGEHNVEEILSRYFLSNEISNYYTKTETSSSIQLSTEFSKKLISSDVNLTYSSEAKKLYLSSGANVSEVDCTDFIKDGMLSNVELCGKTLVFTFNTDAGTTPISINLSTFVDDYSEQIEALSSAISTIGEDYLDSNDKIELYNDLLSPDEVKLYKGPGDKDITLSVGTGSQLCTYTATLSDFYLNSETSSASEISIALINISAEYYTKSQISGVVSSLTESTAIANLFDPTKSYQIDEVTMYNQQLYRCISVTTAGTLPTSIEYWEQTNVTNSDTAFLRDDQGHLIIKDIKTNEIEYIDSYRFNATSVILDATFNDIGTILNGAEYSLPPSIGGHLRDFTIIMQLSGDTLPEFTFPLSDQDLEIWSESIPEWTLNTIYRITFTETRPDKWEIHTVQIDI